MSNNTSNSKPERTAQHQTQATSSSSSSTPPSALNSVVSKLMRAAVGGVPNDIPDDDLDRYIADTILREAAVANKRYNEVGISAFLGKNSLPKANKRFLASVIRSTDAHNDALLRKEREEAELRLRDFKRRQRRELHPDSRDRRRSRGESSSSVLVGTWADESRRGIDRQRRAYKSSQSPDSRRPSSPVWSSPPSPREHRYTQRAMVASRSRSRSPSRSSLRERRRDSSPPSSGEGGRNKRRKSKSAETAGIVRKDKKLMDELNRARRSQGPLPSIDCSSISGESGGNEDVFSLKTSDSGPVRVKRGRGGVGSSRLDKFFQEGYDPGLDISNYDDESLVHYVNRLEELADEQVKAEALHATDISPSPKKKHRESSKHKKKKSKKKSKKRKRDGSVSSETNESDIGDREYGPRKHESRARSHSPDMRATLPAACPW
ncbi:uncharacterized protein SPPG_00306 [Spizellomyces punctatus DAOM BR117]|uniref:Uncharacterized protein n=1 Tax=Spizellomyces punctatus (strain DAOM BR117) TaxID=645134 RepID=A0A0L0HTD2_SPIPD|nr:uncharacterized protein SPPG_00306 [Spizellomyces punctatus DAOM BR117]KND04586.1 hypothetical protein SPPG_00306 [Spizellomyces punctatus DAOM BR117]|eukprot:XP_016612625.1 hypothetical protein SPPG_00306 [Spizellomyces punctatus DAOM BR117]